MARIVRRIADLISDLRHVRRARFNIGCDVQIGKHVHIGRNVTFRSKRVRIGDGTVIKDNVTVEADVFEIGDYGMVYPGCFFPGPGEIRIGHNFWVGKDCIVDSMGGATIGDHVCVGADSQLWTHMKHGDLAYGCRFHKEKPLTIGDDAWLVGHNVVSPVRIGARSMSLPGSVVTRDMAPDRTYAGIPAEDCTEKLGPQFEITAVDYRVAFVEKVLDEFGAQHGGREEFVVVTSEGDMPDVPDRTYFNVADRTYTKRRTTEEVECVRFLLSKRVKFVPLAEG